MTNFLLTVLLTLAWASSALAQAHIIPQKADPGTPRSGEQWISTTVPSMAWYDGATKYYLIDSRLGAQSIGGSRHPDTQLVLQGAFNGTLGMSIETVLTVLNNQQGVGLAVAPTLTEGSSGTHAQLTGLQVIPIFAPGAASTTAVVGTDLIGLNATNASPTTATTLRVAGPSGGATNRALWVTSGASEVDGGLGIGTTPVASNTITFASFVFANIGTALTANGQIGYCSDCTTASPCAGGGTGAFAQRLNGVNVCGVSLTPLSCNGTNCTMASGQLLLPDGTPAAPSLAYSGEVGSGLTRLASGWIGYGTGTVSRFAVNLNGPVISSDANSSLSWGTPTNFTGAPTRDLSLVRDASDILAQRRTTNPQTGKWANTWTSSTNYEYGKAEWASNVFNVGTEKGSGGGTARSMALMTDNTARAIFDPAGGVTFGSTALTVTGTAMAFNKMTASGSAPGAGGAKEEWVCGTNAGTMKKIVYAGTSGTAVTLVDNVGASATGC